MESFFLGETLKYLYLTFDHESFIYNDGSKGVEINFKNSNDEPTSCIVDTGNFIFNTEAHILDGSMLYCCSKEKVRDEEFIEKLVQNVNYRSVIENKLLDNLINLNDLNSKSLNNDQERGSLADQILDDQSEVDGLDCELNKNYCLKLELKQTNYSHCTQVPFIFNNFAKYGEVLKRDAN